MEGILKKKTVEGLDRDLKGTCYPLGGVATEVETDLQSQGFLFQKPKTTNLSMSTDGNVKAVVARVCKLSEAVKKAATNAGAELMHNDSLGFVGTCPSNLGTGQRGGMTICLPKLND